MLKPKLRDSKKRTGSEFYSLGEFPEQVIYEISKWIVYNFAIGKADINGEDWGDIFAKAIDGDHLASPLGLADVVLEGNSWSVKSVKNAKPHDCKEIRVISGRNSPGYSYGINDPHKEPQKTGIAVLAIWNERVNIALDSYNSLRGVTLIRNNNLLEFTLFETELRRFATNEYEWEVNKNGNLEGRNKTNNEHHFTWQPSGGQFTIKSKVPSSAIRFQVKRPPVFDFEETIEKIGFDKSWITIR